MNRPNDAAPVIVFDGVCVLCNGWVKFLRTRDHGLFRFAAMQGDAGRALLESYGLDPDDPRSFLLLDAAGAHVDTDAIVRILQALGDGWRLLAGMLRMVPRPLRDCGYRMIARNRYRWFGQHAACIVPTPEERWRYL